MEVDGGYALARRSLGRSLPEYALLIALVALVAIPALTVLGGSLGGLLTADNTPSQAKQLFSLLDSRTAEPSATAPLASAASIPRPPLDTALRDLQANGGNVVMAFDSAGKLRITSKGLPLGGTDDTTGAQGGALMTALMADQMVALAQMAQEQGLDDMLSARLNYLATIGRNLAKTESDINQAVADKNLDALQYQNKSLEGQLQLTLIPDPVTGKLPVAGQYTYGNLADMFVQLKDDVRMAAQSMANDLAENPDPDVQAIRQHMMIYADAINRVASEHYTKSSSTFVDTEGRYRAKSDTSSSLFPDLSANLDTSQVTIHIAPLFTHAASGKIADSNQPSNANGGYPGSSLPNN